MRLTLLKSKLHRATVTNVELEYEGSCAIDTQLMAAADIHEYERIEIYNVTNGERFTTYAIRGEAGSGIISVNGAAAHKASIHDVVIICTYAELEQSEVSGHQPRLVYVSDRNRVARVAGAIEEQAA